MTWFNMPAQPSIPFLAADTRGCKSGTVAKFDIQWSKPLKRYAPGCLMALQVIPSESSSDAQVRVINSNDRYKDLFKLQRDGVVWWSPNGNYLVIEDHRYSNNYRLLVFRMGAAQAADGLAVRVDSKIQQKILYSLAPMEDLAYFFPRVYEIDNKDAIVSVGFTTTLGGAGSFTPHCQWLDVHLSTGLTGNISPPKHGYNKRNACQLWP
jgi:hypothetical protein